MTDHASPLPLKERQETENTRVGHSQYDRPLATAGSNEVVPSNGGCGYQDVECWVRQLRAAGWTAVRVTRAGMQPIEMGTTWRSPDGLLYRGPYRAWKVMQDAAAERTNDAW